MKTILVLKGLQIECEGSAISPIVDHVKKRLESAHSAYNRACEQLKAEYSTSLPEYPTVEKEWFRFQNWLGVYNVVINFLVSTEINQKSFPNSEGYIERIKK